jgi:hypothetical protein
LCIERRAQLADLRALAGNEAEFFQSLSEELSNVRLAVGDANARRDFSPAERSQLDRFFGLLISHRPPCIDENLTFFLNDPENVAIPDKRAANSE